MAFFSGKQLASDNLVKSIYAQVGYGVIVTKEKNPKVWGLKDNEGITVIDVACGVFKHIVFSISSSSIRNV